MSQERESPAGVKAGPGCHGCVMSGKAPEWLELKSEATEQGGRFQITENFAFQRGLGNEVSYQFWKSV